jgi:hypothetical protein
MTRLFFETARTRRDTLYISDLVLEEIDRAPDRVRFSLMSLIRRIRPLVLSESRESLSLADEYVAARVIPVSSRRCQTYRDRHSRRERRAGLVELQTPGESKKKTTGSFGEHSTWIPADRTGFSRGRFSMSKKWESESLGWIHAIRKRNYEKTKGKSLAALSPGLSAKSNALVKKLKLQRAQVRMPKRRGLNEK